MKYVILVIYAALIFGLCFVVDKVTGWIIRRCQERDTVKPPLRYPVLTCVLLAAAAGLVVYAIHVRKLQYLLGTGVFLAVAVYALVYYRSTEITYNKTSFVFHRGKQKARFHFADIVGQRADVTRKTKCLVLCIGDDQVVVYSNMQGYRRFLTQAYESWCQAKGLDPAAQPWHDPADTRWFPDMPDDEEA